MVRPERPPQRKPLIVLARLGRTDRHSPSTNRRNQRELIAVVQRGCTIGIALIDCECDLSEITRDRGKPRRQRRGRLIDCRAIDKLERSLGNAAALTKDGKKSNGNRHDPPCRGGGDTGRRSGSRSSTTNPIQL